VHPVSPQRQIAPELDALFPGILDRAFKGALCALRGGAGTCRVLAVALRHNAHTGMKTMFLA